MITDPSSEDEGSALVVGSVGPRGYPTAAEMRLVPGERCAWVYGTPDAPKRCGNDAGHVKGTLSGRRPECCDCESYWR